MLSVLISVIAVFATAVGLFSDGISDGTKYTFTSIWGEDVKLQGSGVYSHDSVSAAAQAKAQDGVTLFLAIPLLLSSLIMTIKGSIKGRMLLTGTLGYFLYTYASYSFLTMYNSLFLVYVLLFSLSFFAFILALFSFDKESIHTYFKNSLPSKGIGFSLMVIAFMILFLWLGKILNSLLGGIPPQGLEHYSTLVIQVLDLAILVPLAIVTGIMVIRRQPFGYLLATVVVFKGVTLLLAITAMLAAMIYSGVAVSIAECVIFPTMALAIAACMVILLKHVREPLR
ncbi:hypothetical protein [Paenibacillus odorifer]|uniref:hypothetical protein n=1 Tax=Paenibacillus TaxID=44249 RepID=UPI0009D65D96|nr:hypothetical protein [Paenibacillus odorifer]